MEDMKYKDYKLADGKSFSDGTLFARHYLDDYAWFVHREDGQIIHLMNSELYNSLVENGYWVEC